MKVYLFEDKAAAEKKAADLLINQVNAKYNSTLGLATGGSVSAIYKHVIESHLIDRTSFSHITTFNLDEYVGLAPNHPNSYRYFMDDKLFQHIDIERENTHLPKGDAPNPELEAIAYEQMIVQSGGIDWQLLGIGTNGHIGFNEPKSSLTSRTRVQALTESTLLANARYFRDSTPPQRAITMGIATICESRAIVLVATGSSKSEAVLAMITGDISPECPASVLQRHPHTTIILDKEAASKLEPNELYHNAIKS